MTAPEQGARFSNLRSSHSKTASLTTGTLFMHVGTYRILPHVLNSTRLVLLALDGREQCHEVAKFRKVSEESSLAEVENEYDSLISIHAEI